MNRLYQLAFWLPQRERYFYQAACLLLFVTVSACDGGIFGTGDGNDTGATVVPPNMSTDSNGAAPVESPPGVDGSTTDGNTSDGATTDGQGDMPGETGDSSSSAFENSIGVTNRSDALIRLVNANSVLQDSIVMTVNNKREQPLVPLPGLNYIEGKREYLDIPAAESTSLEVLLADDFSAGRYGLSKNLKPLALAAGSVTTLIVRETPEYLPEEFEVLPLITLSTTGNNNASLRVVHAAKSFTAGSAINVILLPSASDQAVAGYVPLEFSSQPDSAYVTVAPGQYRVQFETAGVSIGLSSSINPIELTAGQTVTLIIRDTQTGIPGIDVDVLLLEDSQLP